MDRASRSFGGAGLSFNNAYLEPGPADAAGRAIRFENIWPVPWCVQTHLVRFKTCRPRQASSSKALFGPTRRSGDSISADDNFTNITLQFVNAGGPVIGSVNFSPGTNQKDTPILDGRDPNIAAGPMDTNTR